VGLGLSCACRQNLDDALEKLQEIIDRAVEFVTPKEADPETIKRVKAQ
jgi:peptidyl-tRNA hydrolase ICT1